MYACNNCTNKTIICLGFVAVQGDCCPGQGKWVNQRYSRSSNHLQRRRKHTVYMLFTLSREDYRAPLTLDVVADGVLMEVDTGAVASIITGADPGFREGGSKIIFTMGEGVPLP